MASDIRSATVVFHCQSADLNLTRPLEQQVNMPPVSQVGIYRDNSRYTVKVYLEDITDEAQVVPIAQEAAEEAIALMCRETDGSISDPIYVTHGFDEVDAEGHHHYRSFTRAGGSGRASVQAYMITPQGERKDLINLRCDQMVEALKSLGTSSRSWRSYRRALSQQGVLAQYLALYKILLEFHNDSQPTVDAFVKQERLAFADERPSPRPPYRMETIFTRLRNEAAHVRNGVNDRQMEEEMRQELPELCNLVKICIQKQGK